jgi:hypothetical protein
LICDTNTLHRNNAFVGERAAVKTLEDGAATTTAARRSGDPLIRREHGMCQADHDES